MVRWFLVLLPACIRDPSLFVELDGDGTGRVVSEPAAIDCGKRCGAIIAKGSPVTLTALPHGSSAFAGWHGGGCAGIEPCAPDLADDTTVVATFTLGHRELAIAKSGRGTGTVVSTPIGISCGHDCSEIYSLGMQIELAAIPDASSRFIGWLGEDDCSATTPCVLHLDRDATITAVFEAP